MKERDLRSEASWGRVPSCTTIAVGKKATVDGSVIIAHSDDDVFDERVIYVPKWPKKIRMMLARVTEEMSTTTPVALATSRNIMLQSFAAI